MPPRQLAKSKMAKRQKTVLPFSFTNLLITNLPIAFVEVLIPYYSFLFFLRG